MSKILLSAMDALPEFHSFSKFVLENQEAISPRLFSQEFTKMQRNFAQGQDRDVFCLQANALAQELLKTENKDLAGIIYSGLCKITEFIPNELERFARQGYEVAKSNGDYVHMMARLNDLRKVYMDRYDKLYDYIQVLFKQEKCLKQLTRHYDESVGSYKSVMRRPAPLQEYRTMLAYVQTEIGKLTKKKHPEDAYKKLYSARQIFEQDGNIRAVKYVEMLISEIDLSQA